MICVNKMLYEKTVLALLFAACFTACSGSAEKPDDPLKYSRKLISEGHSSLYNNGAFAVPYTEIKIIPAGDKPIELAQEMMGMRARQSFLTSIKNAADAVYIIPAGTALSVDYAKDISAGSSTVGNSITDVTRGSGVYIISRSASMGKNMALESWQYGRATASAMNQMGINLEQYSLQSGADVATLFTDAGSSTIDKSLDKAGELAASASSGARKSLQTAGNRFIKGYVAVPEKLSQRGDKIADAARLKHFSDGMDDSLAFRSQYSGVFSNLVTDTTRHYVADVSGSFKNARQAFNEDLDETGFGLALLRASRWVLQGVLWDGLVEPISKLGAGSVGYVSVNLVAFPVMVVAEEGKAVTKLAVEVTWNSAGASYDVVAPTATAAVASVYSIFQFTGGHLAAGATATGGSLLGATEVAAGQVVGNSIKGVGYVSGKTVQYVGVPLTAAGVTLGAGSMGVVAGTAGTVTGSTVVISGEAAALTTKAFGNIIAGTTAVAGTTASVAAGTTVGVYELSKAIVVPAGYELGGGIVLGYGATSQLAAHSVLAVADASYLVLSLEGPRWVVYSVKGNLGSGDDLPPGTLLDLKTMQQSGEEFQYLPISDEEMRSVINGIQTDLPVTNTGI